MAEQCLAEAQEVTLNRARLKGHTATIMAGIALDERDRFRAAKKHILQMDKALVEDIWAYLDFKIFFYDAYALWANGEDLFKKEECANAIKCTPTSTFDLILHHLSSSHMFLSSIPPPPAPCDILSGAHKR